MTDNDDASTLMYDWRVDITDDESGEVVSIPIHVLIDENEGPSYPGYSVPELTTQVTRSDTYTLPLATDPENESITYTYNNDGPAWLNYSQGVFTIGEDATSDADVGSYAFHFTITDGHTPTVYSINWDILPNARPSIESQSDASVLAYHDWDRDISITDADGDSLTNTITTSAPLSLDTTTDNISLSYLPSNADVGSYNVLIESDDGIYTSSETFTFTIIHNDPPSLPALIEEVI